MQKKELLQLLDKKGIAYQITEHDPVFTVEEMLNANLPYPEIIAKNLFIRDDKKQTYYLITVKEDRIINLKDFQKQFGTRRLSFASENDLMAIMGLRKGSVTPFGLLNDGDKKVQFFIGKEFEGGQIGIHTLENIATLWVGVNDIIKLIRENGTTVTVF